MSTPVKLAVLRRRAEFLAVAGSGKKWVAPGFIMQIAKTPDGIASPGSFCLADKPVEAPAPLVRFGLTASKKVGNAVVRNRARRRLRALAREVLQVQAMPGHDFVLIAREGMEKHSYAALAAEITKALTRLKIARAQ